MPAPKEKLLKFLALEAERNFDNKAVVGGLERVQQLWEMDAREARLPEDLIGKISDRLVTYKTLSPEERAAAVEEMMTLLGHSQQPLRNNKPSVSGKSAPYPPPAPQPKHSVQHGLAPQREQTSSGAPAALSAPLTVLKGIGEATASTFKSLGIETLGDLLYYFPRRYDDYSALKPIHRVQYGETLTVIGTVMSASAREARGGKLKITELIVSDSTDYLRVNFYNNPYIIRQYPPGSQVVLSGKIEQYLGRKVMNHPAIESLEREHLNTNRIVPVYPLKPGVTQQTLRKAIHQVVSFWSPRVQDYLPAELRQEAGLVELRTALQQIHFADSNIRLSEAKERLAFDELFLLQMGVLRQKRNWEASQARSVVISDEWLESVVQRFPFELTNAQKKVIAEIRADFASGKAMNRLLQGDVGSGKTAVAALAAMMVIQSGAQAAVLAPTSILAEQHYQNLTRLLTAGDQPLLTPDQLRLLIGDTGLKEKEQIRQDLASGTIKLIIGTHALLEEPVQFSDLQLAVIDEQHRFGVKQRAALRAKGDNPHLLVMTATPIPRSLALTLYGDLDLSVLDEMPAGRKPIETMLLHPLDREKAYRLIEKQVNLGRQAFIIYPQIEQVDEEDDGSKAAVNEHRRLQSEVFPHFKLGLLHGRMKANDKEREMSAFRDGQYQIMVSTSVVEVGVDIPNATVMLIESADHFGLAQLHQFRGRVGRGGDASYCLLIPSADNAIENERLATMVETNDGFLLAEKDLQQRGAGDFIGTRQSGIPQLYLASLMDARLIEKARKLAQKIFAVDPELSAPEHQRLAEMMERFWKDGKGDIS